MNNTFEEYWKFKRFIRPYHTLLILNPNLNCPFPLSSDRSFIDMVAEYEDAYSVEEIMNFAKEVVSEGAAIVILPICLGNYYNSITKEGEEYIGRYRAQNDMAYIEYGLRDSDIFEQHEYPILVLPSVEKTKADLNSDVHESSYIKNRINKDKKLQEMCRFIDGSNTLQEISFIMNVELKEIRTICAENEDIIKVIIT